MTSTREPESDRRPGKVGIARRAAVYAIIVSFSLAAVVGIIALLSGEFGETQGRILLTTVLLGATSITALCHLAIADRAMRVVGVVGLAASSVALVTGLVLIWREWDSPGFDDLLKAFATAGVVAVSFAHANLLLLLAGRRREVIRIGLMVTLVMIAAVAIMIVLPIVSEGEIPGPRNEEWYWRLFGVVGILDALGTVVVPVLAIFLRDAPAVAVVDAAGDAPARPAGGSERLVLTLPADVARTLEHRASADGVDAPQAALAALRRGLAAPAPSPQPPAH
ncbi:MAG: hypothetical protein Q7T15_10600 [Microcella sp.]|uniref:hypothetical protein n=1 Tax=Microcella sp. TaxID=1913979 RepID=UPI00271D9D45|nr:hypothetical protein [Microcella sp.]MDO8338686.1 hypothetical protein [Microcella sp.]